MSGRAGASELLDRIYATGKVEDARGRAIDALPTGLPRAHADELARLVREEGAESTLETGMAVGLSTLAICGVHAERNRGRHVAIDPFQSTDWRSIGRLNVRRAGVEDRVRLLEERSELALPRLVEEGLELDLALIDGLHLFDHTIVDFFYVDRMLRDGGLVVFHDTWMPAVAAAVGYVRTNRAYLDVAAGDDRMAVLRRVDGDDREWDFHRKFDSRLPIRARVSGLFRAPSGRRAA
jgi:predicted O-methyltransferase YrrM